MHNKNAALTNVLARLRRGEELADGEGQWFDAATGQWTAHYVRLRAVAVAV